MLVHLLTLHPNLVHGPLEESILGRAREKGLIDVRVVNIRDFARGPHGQVDDYPYGGGAGLVFKPEPVFAAVEHAVRQGPGRERVPAAGLTGRLPGDPVQILLMDPTGVPFDHNMAVRLARSQHLILVSGRYEGFDERIRRLASAEVSLGDFVLTGGELPALVIIDAVSRLVPGVLGDARSAADDSFATGLLEGPTYTRPPDFRGLRVPPELLSGDHGRIARWRKREALRRTLLRRPDLLAGAGLSAAEQELLAEVAAEEGLTLPER